MSFIRNIFDVGIKSNQFDKYLKNICFNKRDLKIKEYLLNEKIPLLSWCLEITENKTVLSHGSGVYKHSGGIIEGVWSGDFDVLDYASADYVFGTGVTVVKKAIIITPNSHMYEGIFLLHDKETERLVFSNSLSYALSKLYGQIEDLETLVEAIRVSNDRATAAGVFNYNPLMFDGETFSIYCFYYHNVVVSNRGVRVDFRKNKPQFKNFDEYKKYLLKVLKKIIDNGSAESRSSILSPLVTLSKGYDSPAVASLGNSLGVKEAVTVDVNVYGRNDSGIEIASVLGLNCRVCMHPVGKTIENLNINYSTDLAKQAQEFIATVGLGDDIVFFAFDKVLRHRMLFTGALGDSVWNKHDKMPDGIPVRIPYGKSLNEYRLRKGFSHIPVPTIGALYADYIFSLNFFDEMKKYSVGGEYDRPIPRRISEESGISREMFGMAKTATNPNPLDILKYKKNAFEEQILKYK